MNKGFILIGVIVILSFASWMAVQQHVQAAGRMHSAKTEWERIRLMEACRSATEYGRLIVETDTSDVDSLKDEWARDMHISVGDIQTSLRIEDEQGRININRMVHGSGEGNARLLKILGTRTHLDDKQLRRLSETIFEEQKRFAGRIPSVGILASGEWEIDPKAFDDLTVFGSGLININTAPLSVIAALSDRAGINFADEIARHRMQTPFLSAADVKPFFASDMASYALCFPILTIRSSMFRITARATGKNATAVSQSVIQRSGETTSELQTLEYWK